jgi:hypothetical protein
MGQRYYLRSAVSLLYSPQTISPRPRFRILFEFITAPRRLGAQGHEEGTESLGSGSVPRRNQLVALAQIA